MPSSSSHLRDQWDESFSSQISWWMSGAWIRLQRLCSDGANGGMGMMCVLANFRWMSSQPASWGCLGEQTASSVSSLHGLHGAALSAAQHVRLSPLLQASAQVHKSHGERPVIPVCRMQFSLLRFVPPRKSPRPSLRHHSLQN
ncbi:uncharacterized protein LOC125699732 [Lagopus muta]|uniref:uncharacterized protein LOC125699732 n=1 Tax=Lagopus muta TaxID=64668 RepID=UPI0020A188F0|nr:uncharacterized protein LOC125699732 [Lagopus muta]